MGLSPQPRIHFNNLEVVFFHIPTLSTPFLYQLHTLTGCIQRDSRARVKKRRDCANVTLYTFVVSSQSTRSESKARAYIQSENEARACVGEVILSKITVNRNFVFFFPKITSPIYTCVKFHLQRCCQVYWVIEILAFFFSKITHHPECIFS